MKLDRLAAIALTSALAAVFGCGCSATASNAHACSAAAPATPATQTTATIYDAYAAQAAQASTLPNAVGTTNLMSAELNGPAPRVGKAHLAIDERDALDGTDSDENAPKEARRSDGSHRSGSFGTPSK